MGAGDIIIIIFLAAVLAAGLRTAVKRRKQGGCGCGCEGCTVKCHEKKDSLP